MIEMRSAACRSSSSPNFETEVERTHNMCCRRVFDVASEHHGQLQIWKSGSSMLTGQRRQRHRSCGWVIANAKYESRCLVPAPTNQ